MPELSYRMLNIGSAPAGLIGLDELFLQLYQGGVKPEDENLNIKLLEGLRKNNYIPRAAEGDYASVLRMEYVRYFSQNQQGKTFIARDYGTWRGYPRAQIPWFPILSPELCTNCGACLELCAREVYSRDNDGRIWVSEPFLCMVGCCFCKSVCEPQALFFPGQEMLTNYREKM